MPGRTFVGFGFGPIQAGLFLLEARRSGRFDRLVVAEVVPAVVDAVRAAGGACGLNVATPHGIETHEIRGIEILNPLVPGDRAVLVQAVAEAEEMATALPSVKAYGSGLGPADVAAILASGLLKRTESGRPVRSILYAAENHNHAAEILESAVRETVGQDPVRCIRFLNTVIGKMSGVVTDRRQMDEQGLVPLAPGVGRAFLVEAFNRILISRIPWRDFDRGIAAFEEKDDLLPFEEAKLYGHNATHALIGYLARLRGCVYMADAAKDGALMRLAGEAFIEESGGALCRKYAGMDRLFTPAGYREYVDDLLDRMMNPHLRDTVERITRDPRRKVGWEDRLVGTMRLALAQGIKPDRYALGAAAACQMIREEHLRPLEDILDEIWGANPIDETERRQVQELVRSAGGRLHQASP
jgi:mannitol-1-phosphate 5-dehydrogenase